MVYIHTHTQGNGLDEQFNQMLQNMLVKLVHNSKNEWDNYVDASIYAYNTAIHNSSLFTLFELIFGWKTILPLYIEVDERATEKSFPDVVKMTMS